MDELGCGANLAQEHFLARWIRQQIRRQHFEGDDPAHGAVFRFENTAHTAATDLVENFGIVRARSRPAVHEQSFGLKSR